ncbi:MAG: 1-acyl-sn-glycerol-3-phosphate acyltransferase [Candidatus Sulfotelmatobacter sp.]|jgi:1-acyl-sn-glycerol-3-phosphate acyltransferase
MIPDLSDAAYRFQHLAQNKCSKLVVLSSALIYGTGPGRQALVSEEDSVPRQRAHSISHAWQALENLAAQYFDGHTEVTILRPVTVVPSEAWLSRLLCRRFVLTLPGHDVNLQLLSVSDLAQAIRCVLACNRPGIFNVSPDRVVPMHSAIRIAGSNRLSIPRTLLRLAKRADTLDYLRYPWTVSNRKIKQELGFLPAKTSLMALLEARNCTINPATAEPDFDEFGMDRSYIQLYSKTLFKFLSDYYWRTEEIGLENVPKSGRGLLVGMHRGFMPWDGVMALHLLVRKIGRYPRFLVHPGLLKFPFLANFMIKLGGVIACQQSAERILSSGELLGVFPEGIHGAFTRYRDAYRLQSFGRDSFVKIALQHRAPIVPFVTVGSAEIFPILAKIRSKMWNRYADWPCIPVTPTFPLLPIPLPSKWHTRFLPPIHVERAYPPDAANDRSVVKAISREVQWKMQQAIDEMLSRRRSVFFGSLFESENAREGH